MGPKRDQWGAQVSFFGVGLPLFAAVCLISGRATDALDFTDDLGIWDS